MIFSLTLMTGSRAIRLHVLAKRVLFLPKEYYSLRLKKTLFCRGMIFCVVLHGKKKKKKRKISGILWGIAKLRICFACRHFGAMSGVHRLIQGVGAEGELIQHLVHRAFLNFNNTL